MYLHLGQSVVVPEASVIGVFDLDNTTGSHITRKFLGDAEKAGCVISVSDDLPKSFVVCSEESPRRARPPHFSKGEKAEVKIYLSQLSSQTLRSRFAPGFPEQLRNEKHVHDRGADN